MYMQTMQAKLHAWSAIGLLMLGTMAIPMVATVAVVPMVGCTISVSEIANDAIAVSEVSMQLANAAVSLYPAIAAQVTNAASDVSAIAYGVLSGVNTEAKLVAALQVLDAILSKIPASVPQEIAIFLPIAIAGIQAIYGYVGQNSTVLAKKALTSTSSVWESKAKNVKVHHVFLRSRGGDFKAVWNDNVKVHPSAGFVKI